MGANAQTTVPTFTASQVLTADQQNQSARTGVPVFATTVTRDAAFGGTGEKTLAEGQLCYVEGTGLQTYNGTSWVTWGTAPSGGLDLITSQTIGSAVSSVTVSNCFSATYDNYKIIISGGAGSVASTGMSLQFGSTTTGYYYNVVQYTWAGAAQIGSGSNVANFDGVGGSSTTSIFANIEVLSPFLTENTFVTATRAVPSTTSVGGILNGYLNDTTSYSAFTIAPGSGTLTGGTIKVYGYKN